MSSDNDKMVSSVFLVRTEHLNHCGHLFGGVLMAEIDTVGFCLLREIYEDKSFVTRAADIEFVRPAWLGDAIEFEAKAARRGNTSVQVDVRVSVRNTLIGTGRMVYVNVDASGAKVPL